MVANGLSKKRNDMKEKIKNILRNSYTNQGEFDEGKALNELCVLLGVSKCDHPRSKTLEEQRQELLGSTWYCTKE
jgi:hypothetical protein